MKTIEQVDQGRPESAETAPISSALDFYKPTMSQFAYTYEPQAETTFTFHNRGGQLISEYVEPIQLQARLDEIARRGWAENELEFLAGIAINGGQPAFAPDFLDYLKSSSLPEVEVKRSRRTDELAVETTGKWPMTTFWETIVMANVSEIYFENYMREQGLDPAEVYAEGDRRLDEKIDYLKAHPDIKIAEFGTRRRFSLNWQDHVVQRLASECPENFLGTSNIYLAQKYAVKAIGTMAHELDMVYAGLADARGQDIRSSHRKMLDDWYKLYGREYSIALTDTFGSDFFFEDFTAEQARDWLGVRQDSGNPVKLGEKLISFYENLGIDPKTKVLIFSDNLNQVKIDKLHERFGERVMGSNGWGTNLTNDLGLTALNQVMKATAVRLSGAQRPTKTIKFSDDAGKLIGPKRQAKKYREIFAAT